jgi:tetratricopeptide (TPR) repeat protein
MNDEIYRLFNDGVGATLHAQQAGERGDHEAANRCMDQALEAFDRVLALDPQNLGALSWSGMCLAQLGRAAEAVSRFQRAIEVEPGFAENHRQLGLCHAELGDMEGAGPAIIRAIELDGSAEYRRGAVVELYNMGGHVMRLAAGHRDAGRRDEEQRSYRHAQGLFALVLEIEPGNPHALKALPIVDRCLGIQD